MIFSIKTVYFFELADLKPDYMNVSESVIKLIDTLRERPLMVISGSNIEYRDVKIYLEAYLDGID